MSVINTDDTHVSSLPLNHTNENVAALPEQQLKITAKSITILFYLLFIYSHTHKIVIIMQYVFVIGFVALDIFLCFGRIF